MTDPRRPAMPPRQPSQAPTRAEAEHPRAVGEPRDFETTSTMTIAIPAPEDPAPSPQTPTVAAADGSPSPWLRVSEHDDQQPPAPPVQGPDANADVSAPMRAAAGRASAVAAARVEAAFAKLSISRADATVTTRVQERITEKKRASRRLRAIVWGRRSAYVGGVALAAWVVLASPLFALEPAKVTVTGYGTVVDPAAVRAVVDTHDGAALPMLNTSALSDELDDIAGVRTAHIERSWPRGLIVTLESREPVASVPDPQGGFVYVDDEGVHVGRSSAQPKDIPVIYVPLGSENVRTLKAVLGVLNAMPAALRDRVGHIAAKTEDSVSFTLHKGPVVEWGSAERSELKVEVLQVLLDSPQASKADVIDVSAPTLPITKKS